MRLLLRRSVGAAPGVTAIAGAVLFVAAKGLKIWAIASLGAAHAETWVPVADAAILAWRSDVVATARVSETGGETTVTLYRIQP